MLSSTARCRGLCTEGGMTLSKTTSRLSLSERMARIRKFNTRPEMAVRRFIHAHGYRYSLHARDMPGTPDLVFPRLRKVIFVHGCFWHRHKGCARTTSPKTRRDYWAQKFECNIKRDAQKKKLLKARGWDVLIVWECQTFETDSLSRRIAAF